MKALVAIVVATAVLYAVDQEYAAGHYSYTAQFMLGQIMHSIGI
jgi:hypothetical protein